MTDDDIFETLPEQQSSLLGDRLERIWKEEYGTLKYKETALHRALLKLFGGRFLLYGIIKGFGDFFMVILLPISIQKVVSHFQGRKELKSEWEIYLYSGLISLVFVIDAITSHPPLMGLSHVCMKIRIACSSIIYRKALRLSNLSLTKTTVGQVINLLSNDVSRFEEGFVLCHFLWIAPVQACFGVYLIYREIQVSALFGIAFLLAFVPLQIWVGKKTSNLRLQTAVKTDERVRIMNEIIAGIQVIKMYCWEKPFSKLIEHVRKGEMEAIRTRNFLIGIIYAFEMFITRTSIFISIISFVFMGNYITADKVFVITGIYNVIRPVITTLFSISVSCVTAVDVSIRRINTFLSIEELAQCEKSVSFKLVNKNSFKNGEFKSMDLSKNSIIGEGIHIRGDTKKPGVVLENVDASWTENIEEKVLKNLNLKIEEKQLVAIIGPVGSGKSSFLHLLLKEMNIVAGKMDIYGKMSYAAQEPWLFSGSIRQNILFGEKYDEVRYKSIIKVCALEEDIGLLPHGDKTLVGERGIILSGGQKARINLARCVYRQADIYLLDDPLSAVDARVGKILYFDCVHNFLRNKICILVTHQIQYLHTSDQILMMENGVIRQSGTFDQLRTENSNFAKFLENLHSKETETIKNERTIMISEVGSEKNVNVETKEKINHGKISFKTYYKYARSGGSVLQILLLMGTFVLATFIAFGGDFYVSYWVNKEQDLATSNHTINTKVPFSRDVIIYTYSVITFGTIVFSLGQTMFFVVFLTKVSRNLHNSALDRVTKATMKFFHLNPSGRILNRFSEDIGVVDEVLPFILYDVVKIALLSVSVVVLTSYVEIYMLPISLLIGVLFASFRTIFLKTSRNVKRIVAIKVLCIPT
ncbi:hypothetical protein WA026_003519 [Henosepilachna vigintioctopunctata]|uniref:Uncharacterized protein n=1 Tax=Henosepilachna vigintioctopunctata TaxID=420089 RepID=A0AAW1THM0_9CUCU